MKIKREKVDEIIEAAADYTMELCRDGSPLSFHYIRIYPDGKFFTGAEASRCIPQSEYFGEENAPITIQLGGSYNPPAGPAEGFIWEECSSEQGEYYGDFSSGDYISIEEYRELSEENKKKFPTPFKLSGWTEYPDRFDEDLENEMKDRGIEIVE